MFSTKQTGDIAEYKVISELLSRGYNVLLPVGDRLPYDVALDCDGRLLKLQVKSAFKSKLTYTINTRRIQTNRKIAKSSLYSYGDFDFAVVYHPISGDFYVIPFYIFSQYKSGISVGSPRGRIEEYKNKWDLLTL